MIETHLGQEDTNQADMAPELSVNHRAREEIHIDIALEISLNRLVREDIRGAVILDITLEVSPGLNLWNRLHNLGLIPLWRY